MSPPHRPEAWRAYKDTIEACLREGYGPPGYPSQKGLAVQEATRRLKESDVLDKETITPLFWWLRRQKRRAKVGQDHFLPDWSLYRHADSNPLPSVPKSTPVVDEKAERQTAHEEGFWRKRSKQLAKTLAETEHVLQEVSGIRSDHVQPASWLMTKPNDKRHRCVIGLLFTDLHMGEVISSEELLGLNEYNPEIAERRARRFFDASCIMGHRWASDSEVQGAFLALGGDMISADLHEELKMSNALTSVEQVRAAASVIIAGIHRLKEAYKLVHVASVPGNHGRTTLKPTAKLYSRLSYDTLVAAMVADAFNGDDDVTFQISASPDALIPILGHTILLTHGDKLGGGSGTGFIGPMAPIIRGAKKVEAQQARVNRRPDLILHGHFHTSGAPGNVLSNGSFPGYSEYGHSLRASIEPPQQWAFLMHQTWGLRERCEVKLEDPIIPPIPRVGIPAVMRDRG